MSEDQSFYEACDAVSADAPKPMQSREQIQQFYRFIGVVIDREINKSDSYMHGYYDALKWVLREE